MTPFHNPNTESQERYNQAHAVTRSIIERTFGILKSRFRCLDESGGCLLLSPEKVCRVTVVCCMLHNMATERRLPVPVMEENSQQQDDPPGVEDEIPVGRAAQVRQRIVDQHF